MGLTPAERALVFWYVSWIWGLPTDDPSHLLSTIGLIGLSLARCGRYGLCKVWRPNLALVGEDARHAGLADPHTWRDRAAFKR